jgi:hypothetical protein
MENKYYTPEISEFYPGFEYEYCMLENQLPIWKKDFFGKIINDTKTLEWLYKLGIRVKYLDQQDIKSLGFEENFYGFWLNNKCLHFDGSTYITIDNGESQDQQVFYFQGNIKNKSELVKLLKQLGINE